MLLKAGRPLPDPEELPDEVDFEPDELNAAPARPFRVEDSPVKLWESERILNDDN